MGYSHALCRAHSCAKDLDKADLPIEVQAGPIEGGRMAFEKEINTFISYAISL
jgi:hypothetical protein